MKHKRKFLKPKNNDRLLRTPLKYFKGRLKEIIKETLQSQDYSSPCVKKHIRKLETIAASPTKEQVKYTNRIGPLIRALNYIDQELQVEKYMVPVDATRQEINATTKESLKFYMRRLHQATKEW